MEAFKPPVVVVVDTVVDAGILRMVVVVERSLVDPDCAPIGRKGRSQGPCTPCHSWSSRGSRPSSVVVA